MPRKLRFHSLSSKSLLIFLYWGNQYCSYTLAFRNDYLKSSHRQGQFLFIYVLFNDPQYYVFRKNLLFSFCLEPSCCASTIRIHFITFCLCQGFIWWHLDSSFQFLCMQVFFSSVEVELRVFSCELVYEVPEMKIVGSFWEFP